MIDGQSVNPEDDLRGVGVGSRGCPRGRAEGLPNEGKPRKEEIRRQPKGGGRKGKGELGRGEGKGEGDGMGKGSTDTKDLRRKSYLQYQG